MKDKRRIIPSSVYLNGEYGIKDCFVGVPVVLGKKGVEKIIRLKLDAKEKKEFYGAFKSIKTLINKVKWAT